MSAPLAVNTVDGTVWTRREGTRGGEALYAPEKCGICPAFVMVTMTELAELGIVGSADVLPMPVGRVRDVEDELADARLALFEEEQETAALREERRSPNEALDDAIRALRVAQERIAVLEAQRERRRLRLVALQNDALDMRGSLSPMGEGRKVPFPLGETLTPAVDWLIARVAELEASNAALEKRLHDAVMTRVWKNEDGKKFVFVEDIAPALLGLKPKPDGITQRIAPTQALQSEGEHYASVHHAYTHGRDLDFGGPR